MQIHIILHSILREKLPPEAKGQTILSFSSEVRVRDVIQELALPDFVIWAVNDQLDRDRDRLLEDGDTLRFFRPGSGG